MMRSPCRCRARSWRRWQHDAKGVKSACSAAGDAQGRRENNTHGGECGASEEGQDFALEGKSGKKLDSQRQEFCILLTTEGVEAGLPRTQGLGTRSVFRTTVPEGLLLLLLL